MGNRRKNTFTTFLSDIIDDTKDLVDDLVDRARDVEEDVRKSARNLVDDEETTSESDVADLKKALAQLTSKLEQLDAKKVAKK